MLRFLQLATALRIKNIMIRRKDREDLKALIIQREFEASERLNKLETDRQEYQSNLEPGVEYDEEEFFKDWEEKNPEIEIPPLGEEEMDLDFEEQQVAGN